ELASATVDLHNLQVKQAEDGVALAALQKDRADIQYDHFDDLINNGVSGLESASMALSMIGSVVSGAASGGAAKGPAGAVAGGIAGAITGLGSLFGQISSNERREEDWRFQLSLFQQDVAIGSQQVGIAMDQLAVAAQEQRIAQIQLDHAGAT